MVKVLNIVLAMAVIASFGTFTACAADADGNQSGEITPETPAESTESETPVTPESPADEETPTDNETSNSDETTGSNILIAYFSYSGNTETEAEYIQSQIGGTLYEIDPVTPYPTTSYTIWGNDARDERDNDARPEIKNLLSAEEVAGYDVVFIGFPIWWHTAPMIIGTFLENYTWTSDMDIYPFFQGASNSTQEYYDNSMAFVKRCAVGATVHDGLYASHTNTTAINNYLKDNGFIK